MILCNLYILMEFLIKTKEKKKENVWFDTLGGGGEWVGGREVGVKKKLIQKKN